MGLYVNATKTEFTYFKFEGPTEIRSPVHIPRRQYLIYGNRFQHTHSEDVNCYR